MDKAEIFERMRPLIADSLALKLPDISPESRLINDLGADSLELIEKRVSRPFDVIDE